MNFCDVVKVETTEAIAGVRGTEFGVEGNTFSVLSGRLVINNLDGTLIDFVDSNQGDRIEDDDILVPQKAAVTAGAFTVTPLIPAELEDIHENHYRIIPLNNSMVPRVLSVTGLNVTVEGLYKSLGN